MARVLSPTLDRAPFGLAATLRAPVRTKRAHAPVHICERSEQEILQHQNFARAASEICQAQRVKNCNRIL